MNISGYRATVCTTYSKDYKRRVERHVMIKILSLVPFKTDMDTSRMPHWNLDIIYYLKLESKNYLRTARYKKYLSQEILLCAFVRFFSGLYPNIPLYFINRCLIIIIIFNVSLLLSFFEGNPCIFLKFNLCEISSNFTVPFVRCIYFVTVF